MIKEYLLENWALLLVAIAFVILLKTTVFLERRKTTRLYALIISVVLLSIVVYEEFWLDAQDLLPDIRVILMAIRYSATPFITAMVLYALITEQKWFVFVPAAVFAVINFISIPTGIVFSIDENDKLVRGPLGYLPYIAVGLYSVALIFMLFKNCNKRASEIVPIIFMSFSFLSGMVLPFIIGKDYSRIFCTTIMVALFVYYVFAIFQLTSKDALTGLLNRQAYKASVRENARTITAIVSIDMNGLKVVNDKYGHAAGDEALITLAHCFLHVCKGRQTVFRLGGDEFVIVCRRSKEEEIKKLTENIRSTVSQTKYSCSIGYSYSSDGQKTIEEMLKESDEMMYADKDEYYKKTGLKRPVKA